jgi:hypothetical protein
MASKHTLVKISQKDKYLMADKKLRIPRKLKTETHKQLKIRTDMNSYAPYESAVRTSLMPLHGIKIHVHL